MSVVTPKATGRKIKRTYVVKVGRNWCGSERNTNPILAGAARQKWKMRRA